MTEQAAGHPGAAVLWKPSVTARTTSRLSAYADLVLERYGAPTDSYDALWRWSVEHLEEFWAAAWEHFDVLASAPYEQVLTTREMPGARWFTGARLNLAENVLRPERDGTALVAVCEQGPARKVTWAELRGLVGAFQATLTNLGVHEGDRVVAYLPNGVEAVVALLACAALGAVWSTCGPDIGAASAVDRLGQLSPTVLITADGYRFGGKERDRTGAVAELLDGLPTVRAVVAVPVIGLGIARAGLEVIAWADAVQEPRTPVYAQLDAEAPLWVVYSSGTTGLPKGLVHSHAGALLMGLVQQGLQYDLGEGDRSFWYTSTSWIMWNSQIAALSSGATAVLYDGSPLWPSPDRLWQLAQEQRLTSLGTSPGYLLACEKAGLQPGRDHDLAALRAVGVTGSRCHPARSAGCTSRSARTSPCTSSAAVPTSLPRWSATRPGCRSPKVRCPAGASASTWSPGTSRAGHCSTRSASSSCSPRCPRCRWGSGAIRTARATARPTSHRRTRPGPRGCGDTATG